MPSAARRSRQRQAARRTCSLRFQSRASLQTWPSEHLRAAPRALRPTSTRQVERLTWSSNNSNTISLSCTTNGCGNSDDYTAKAPSTTQGDTTITVKYTYNGQYATANSKAITVHQPKSLQTISTIPNFTTTACAIACLANPNSGSCAVTSGTSCSYSEPITQRNYSVLDQFGNTYQSVNLGAAAVITESVNAQQGTCGGNGVETGSTSGSPFYDDFGKCDSCCESGGPGCTSTASQTLFSNGVNVRQESISETCTSVTLTP